MRNKAKVFSRFEFSQKFFRFLLVDRIMIKKDNLVLITGKRGDGKCLKEGSKILMSDGSRKKIENIRIGDEVISPQLDGSCTFEKVTALHSRFEKEMYDVVEVGRKNKVLYTCTWNHEIPILRGVSERVRDEFGKCTERRKMHKVLDLYNARRLSNMYTKDSKISTFTTTAIEYNGIKDSKIKPYSLGVFIGDGCFVEKMSSPKIYNPNREILYEVNKEYKYLSRLKYGDRCEYYNFSSKSEFTKELKRVELHGKKSGDKFIPKECLLSSIEYRFKLLAGLIDTDGYLANGNRMSYTTKSETLSKNVRDLVFSLGGYASICKVNKKCQNNFEGKYFTITISFENPTIIPLKCNHKRERLKEVSRNNPRNIGIKCVRADPAKIYGFTITGKSKWHIVNDWMVTHNTSLSLKLILGFSEIDGLEDYYNQEVNKKLDKKTKYKLDSFKSFDLEKDMAFTRKDLQELCKNNVKGFILADEAIVNAARRNSMTKANKILHEVLTINRKNSNTVFFCLPSIEDFDISILQYVTHWIHIDDRGLGCVLMPEAKSIFGRKTWDIDRMKKIYDKFLEDNPTVISVPYWLFDNFRGYIRFKALSKNVEERYLKIANEKKNSDSDLEEVKVKEPKIPKEKTDILERLADKLISGEITDTAEYYSHCLDMDFKKNKLNREINEILAKKGDGRTATRIIKENKVKGKDYTDKSLQADSVIIS